MIAFDVVDGERGAVERDGALFGDETRERRGRLDPEPLHTVECLIDDDRRDAIDMPRDEMAAQLVGDLERAFEIYFVPTFQLRTVVRASVSAPTSTSNQLSCRALRL